MRDSHAFDSPKSHALKILADEIKSHIEREDFEEAILNMTGLVVLNVVTQLRALYKLQAAQLLLLALIVWRTW